MLEKGIVLEMKCEGFSPTPAGITQLTLTIYLQRGTFPFCITCRGSQIEFFFSNYICCHIHVVFAAGFIFYPLVYIIIFIIQTYTVLFFVFFFVVHRIQAVLLTTPNLDASKMTERNLVHYPSYCSLIVIHAVRFLAARLSTGITGTNIWLTWFAVVLKQQKTRSTPSLACSTLVSKISHILIKIGDLLLLAT